MAVQPGVYMFASAGAGAVIDLRAGSSADGTDLINYRNHGGKNQHWQVAQVGYFEYLILNDATGTYFTAPPYGRGQLTGNLISPTDRRVRWRIHRNRNGTYEIESVAFPGRVVDNAGDRAANGNPIILWERNGGLNQQWWFR
ncbi:hypothetical protein PHISP_04233 [Aspergillus sp. HF37]|nr:hypothetical protein PHISP_04233 [Aspergillus sp. HF37]